MLGGDAVADPPLDGGQLACFGLYHSTRTPSRVRHHAQQFRFIYTGQRRWKFCAYPERTPGEVSVGRGAVELIWFNERKSISIPTPPSAKPSTCCAGPSSVSWRTAKPMIGRQ